MECYVLRLGKDSTPTSRHVSTNISLGHFFTFVYINHKRIFTKKGSIDSVNLHCAAFLWEHSMSLAATPAKHKVLCIVSLHVLVLALVRGDGPVSCAGGWALIGDRCFHYSAEERNYDDSVAYCHSLGSVIASIHSETENEAVTGLIPTGDGRSAYIGAESNGHWVAQWYPFSLFWFKVPLKSSQPPKGCPHNEMVTGLPRRACVELV